MTKPKKKIRRTRTDVSKLVLTQMVNGHILHKDDQLNINPKIFVQVFRESFEKWLCKRAMKESGFTEENISKPDKETIIQDLMEGSNYTRQQAEVAAAIELGDTNGDVIELDDKQLYFLRQTAFGQKQTFVARLHRLYEQKKTDGNCQTILGEYIRRWQRWTKAGFNNESHIRHVLWQNKTPHDGGVKVIVNTTVVSVLNAHFPSCCPD